MHSNTCIGIRREDKNVWERRTPLAPNDVRALTENEGLAFRVQPSKIRVFKDDEYAEAGAKISEDLAGCGIVFAIKEIPIDFIRKGATYVFFSHTIKGQPHNMPMLKRIIDEGATLIDYERVVDEHNRRLIFFGEYAGLAGMIDTLWAFGRRLAWEGIANPFDQIRLAHEYENLDAAEEAISDAGELIETRGLDPALSPLIIGVTGYGNVSRGAQKMLTYLPIAEIEPAEIPLIVGGGANPRVVYKVVFREAHTVEPVSKDAVFELKDFYAHPERYRSRFYNYLQSLSILVNCIYWDKRYPRLVTKAELKNLFGGGRKPPLRVVGDISCDIEGAVEFTVKATDPRNPVFVYDPFEGQAKDGVEGRGPVVLAVDNLPCELPRESSNEFSHIVKRFVPTIAMADFAVDFEKLDLPPELKRAVIVCKGKLTPEYAYLEEHLKNY